MVLTALLIATGAARPRLSAAPERLAVYYGYPSLVNGAGGDRTRAAAEFSQYDVVIVGDALAFGADGGAPAAGPDEHAFTTRLMADLRRSPRGTQVYGYVDIGRTQGLELPQVNDRLDRWARMGAAGVLLDEAGYDFGVTRTRQNAAVRAAHDRGLDVCLNAFDPSDLSGTDVVPLNAVGGGNPDGLAPALAARDAILLESYAVRNGEPESIERLTARTRAALRARTRLGVRVWAVATGGEGADPALFGFGWWTAAASGVDAYGWGAPAYSAVTSRLPWIPRPAAETALAGAEYLAALNVGTGRWRRPTTSGTIVVDLKTRRGVLEPPR